MVPITMVDLQVKRKLAQMANASPIQKVLGEQKLKVEAFGVRNAMV